LFRFDGKEIEVRPAMSTVRLLLRRKKNPPERQVFRCTKGDEIVVGHQGIRVVPVQRSTTHTDIFQFINTIVDARRTKIGHHSRTGRELRRAHTAKVKRDCRRPCNCTNGALTFGGLIEAGYVDRLFRRKFICAYDVEHTLFGPHWE